MESVNFLLNHTSVCQISEFCGVAIFYSGGLVHPLRLRLGVNLRISVSWVFVLGNIFEGGVKILNDVHR